MISFSDERKILPIYKLAATRTYNRSGLGKRFYHPGARVKYLLRWLQGILIKRFERVDRIFTLC